MKATSSVQQRGAVRELNAVDLRQNKMVITGSMSQISQSNSNNPALSAGICGSLASSFSSSRSRRAWNRPFRRRAAALRESRASDTLTNGGSKDTLQRELTAMETLPPDRMATPEGTKPAAGPKSADKLACRGRVTDESAWISRSPSSAARGTRLSFGMRACSRSAIRHLLVMYLGTSIP